MSISGRGLLYRLGRAGLVGCRVGMVRISIRVRGTFKFRFRLRVIIVSTAPTDRQSLKASERRYRAVKRYTLADGKLKGGHTMLPLRLT